MESTNSIVCRSQASLPNPVLSLSMLPSDTTVFFDNWPHRSHRLPTPAEIRTCTFSSHFKILNERPTVQRILHFPDLGLVVKHGRRTTIAEGQMLWVIGNFCPEIRAPTVYGWCTDNGEVFMYLSYIDSVTLYSRLENLNDDELRDIACQLALMLGSLRRVTQPAEEAFIGSLDHGPVNDQIWWDEARKRSFSSVKEYNQALFEFGRRLPMFPAHEIFQSVRASLPDTASICLTHTDLGTENIIISPTGATIMGGIDWQGSGWYPDYWGYIKLRWLSPTKWDKFSYLVLHPCEREFEAINIYGSMGIMTWTKYCRNAYFNAA